MTKRDVYITALQRIEPIIWRDLDDASDDDLRQILVGYCTNTKQTTDARIARIALKEAAYLSLNGPKQD